MKRVAFALAATLFTQHATALEHAINDYLHWGLSEQLIELKVDEARYPSLWLEQQSAAHYGVVWLLPDSAQTAHQAPSISYLREHLPSRGWQSYAIALPAHFVSETQNLTAILNAAQAQQPASQGQHMVIAQGRVAWQLVEQYQQNKLALPDALVLLDAHGDTLKDNENLANQLASLPMPVLDIFAPSYHGWNTSAASLRQQAALKAQKSNYRQQQIDDSRHQINQPRIGKIIDGWFRKQQP